MVRKTIVHKVITCLHPYVICGNVYAVPDGESDGRYRVLKDGDNDCIWEDGLIFESELGVKWVDRETYRKHFQTRSSNADG